MSTFAGLMLRGFASFSAIISDVRDLQKLRNKPPGISAETLATASSKAKKQKLKVVGLDCSVEEKPLDCLAERPVQTSLWWLC